MRIVQRSLVEQARVESGTKALLVESLADEDERLGALGGDPQSSDSDFIDVTGDAL